MPRVSEPPSSMVPLHVGCLVDLPDFARTEAHAAKGWVGSAHACSSCCPSAGFHEAALYRAYSYLCAAVEVSICAACIAAVPRVTTTQSAISASVPPRAISMATSIWPRQAWRRALRREGFSVGEQLQVALVLLAGSAGRSSCR